MTSEIKTTHNLLFESAISLPYHVFRIGTCQGQWGATWDSYFILSVINHKPGNGHLNDVFEWFEYSCERDGRNLLVLECFNNSFAIHLVNKRGFQPLDADGDNYIKIFNKNSYKRLKKRGNEILVPGTLKCK